MRGRTWLVKSGSSEGNLRPVRLGCWGGRQYYHGLRLSDQKWMIENRAFGIQVSTVLIAAYCCYFLRLLRVSRPTCSAFPRETDAALRACDGTFERPGETRNS